MTMTKPQHVRRFSADGHSENCQNLGLAEHRWPLAASVDVSLHANDSIQ